MAKRKWYVVTVGRDVGVFKTWIEVSPLVTGVSGALHQSFPSEEEAQIIFDEALIRGDVRIVGTAKGPAETNPSSQSHREFPILSGQPCPQYDLTHSRRPLTRIAGGNAHSQQSSTLNAVKSEVLETTSHSSYRNSSPPTGVTQLVSLSSSSRPLSPLALQENELEPDGGSVQSASSGQPSSNLHSPHRVAASCSMQSSSDALPPSSPREENLDSLSSRVAALGLSQDNDVSCAADPRSPLRQPGLLPSLQ
ncbi:hypothetical protein B0H19DRAFT_1092925 [Mycena capillaripes]|nr:hypothetical protein B0H19DRAFT_1092925 [Mycena capillaripes]